MSNIGNVYIADRYNHRIRKVTVSTGIITTIAGTGTGSYTGDNGAATSATLKYPSGVAVDASGRILYYCPLHCYTVSSAMFDEIFFIFFNIPVSNIGNVYIADTENHRIRKVTVSTSAPPRYVLLIYYTSVSHSFCRFILLRPQLCTKSITYTNS